MLAIVKQFQSIIVAIIILFSSLFSTGSLPKAATVPDTEPGIYGQYVDPFIGTGGIPWASAMLYPGATSPFGAVKLSPDTTFIGGIDPFSMATAGYHYAQNYLWGFSHTRLSGTGIRDMGNFRVTPAVGDKNPAKRLSAPIVFSHDEEAATAGYYAVNLSSINCLAELTATTHAGVHRYTFNTSKDAHLFIDATSFLAGGSASEGKITVLPESNEVIGEARLFTGFTDRYGGLKAYFVAQFDTDFKSFSTWEGKNSVEGRTSASGNDTGANFNFGNIQGKSVELKLGISFVSVENARENLETETGGRDFDAVRASTRDTWDSWLSRVDIETDDETIKTIFYTAMYHSMLMPTTYTDVNGQYLGFDETIGVADGYTYRSDMSLWDTFRTTHSLYTLIAPDIQNDCLNSLVEMAKIGGALPRWPSGAGYTGSMIGSPADMVIAESYLKGYTDFDYETAYEYMKKVSEEEMPSGKDGRKFINEYNALGYVPDDVHDKSVSRTLEYAWADKSISLMAAALGYEEESEYYAQKALNYKNTFNPKTKYFQARNADGSWGTLMPNMTTFYDEILPVDVSGAYCEGSARHWRWCVPQDTAGLLELFGDNEYFISELNAFMEDASPTLASINPGAGYWHGNQHDMHAAYLFNDAGAPELTQKWVRWILDKRYSTAVNGLDGNDDGGTLSSWYILSSVGLYSKAGTDEYWIGSPNVDKATLNLGEGKTLTIIAENQSAENIYVQSVTLNGEKLSSATIKHADLVTGDATLVFVMGSTPAENGGF